MMLMTTSSSTSVNACFLKMRRFIGVVPVNKKLVSANLSPHAHSCLFPFHVSAAMSSLRSQQGFASGKCCFSLDPLLYLVRYVVHLVRYPLSTAVLNHPRASEMMLQQYRTNPAFKSKMDLIRKTGHRWLVTPKIVTDLGISEQDAGKMYDLAMNLPV